MIIATVFKVLSVGKNTKGWSPGHSKQEVSKMKRDEQRTLIKRGDGELGEDSRELEEKPAECGIQKSRK